MQKKRKYPCKGEEEHIHLPLDYKPYTHRCGCSSKPNGSFFGSRVGCEASASKKLTECRKLLAASKKRLLRIDLGYTTYSTESHCQDDIHVLKRKNKKERERYEHMLEY